MFEPDITGISYSFTSDGYYEEAYYRALSNRKNQTVIATDQLLMMNTAIEPACPKGMIQWQHGKYTKNANGSLSLFPFAVDGRQLQSDPCNFRTSLYTRYAQFELIKVGFPAKGEPTVIPEN